MQGGAVVLRKSLSKRFAGVGSSFFFSSEIVIDTVQQLENDLLSYVLFQ